MAIASVLGLAGCLLHALAQMLNVRLAVAWGHNGPHQKHKSHDGQQLRSPDEFHIKRP